MHGAPQPQLCSQSTDPAGCRPDPRASPIRRMWAQLITSQSLIDFDDDVASDVLAQRQAAAAAHPAEPSARPPQEAPTDLDRRVSA